MTFRDCDDCGAPVDLHAGSEPNFGCPVCDEIVCSDCWVKHVRGHQPEAIEEEIEPRKDRAA